MNAIAKFFAPIISFLLILGMYLGIVNPPVAEFAPGTVEVEVYDGPVLTLIEGGASDYVIVKGAGASPSENTASEKLQGYLEQIGGALIPIVDDSAAPSAKEIIVGETNRETPGMLDRAALGDDGFIIKTDGDNIFIAGGARGTIYGVFDFLEKFLGCRWLANDMIIIPPSAVVEVPEEIDEYEIPAFYYREPSVVNLPAAAVNPDYALANRINAIGRIGNALADKEEYGGTLHYPCWHAGEVIMPTSVYYPIHPEYFALNADGVTRAGDNPNPCASNPDVIDFYINYALNLVASQPNTKSISMCINDSDVICYCDECGGTHAGYSEAYMKMLNAVCDALRDAGRGDVKIVTFAYAATMEAPETKADDNVIVFFCPIGMCYMHKAGECEQELTQYIFQGMLQDWREVCDNIMFFEYPCTYDHYGIPYPIWGALQSYMQYYSANNVKGLLNCTNAAGDMNFYVMSTYLYAKLLWNPDVDLEKVYKEFLPLYYGEGWQYIREYLRISGDELSGKTIGGVQQHGQCQKGATTAGHFMATNNELKYCDALWENAKNLASGQQLVNIRRAEISYRIWKSENFRNEFWILKTGSRVEANKSLFEDIWELGLIEHDEGSLYLGADDFYELQLYLLTPRYWSWRQLGRDNEGNVSSFFEILFKMI
ncbi:MAG: DUF4838 domain-containing protein [Oscillospiraceae bacterium]|nr:DUF4838 domain-containing protein [Oscillospiraceae bacterium]